MELNVAVNVGMSSCGRPNRYELLAWLNTTLQTRFTKVEQVCTGAAFCQLMDLLFPSSLDLSAVRFQGNDMVDAVHNYSLLQAAFRKVGVVRHIPTESLVKKSPAVAVTFLMWFKAFFDKNKNNDREYRALEARGGQNLAPADAEGHSSQNPPQKPEINVKTKGKTVEAPNKEKDTAVVLVISDDDDLIDVTVEQKMETNVKEEKTDVEQNPEKMGMKLKVEEAEAEQNIDINLKVEEAEVEQEAQQMETALKEEETEVEQEAQQMETALKEEETEVEQVEDRGNDSSSKSLLHFIRRHCGGREDTTFSPGTDSQVPATLSPAHPADIVRACSRLPYCLYLYVDVELGGGQNNSVVLIGYLDPSSGVSVLRPLLTLRTSVPAADLQTSADSDTDESTDTRAAETDARLLIQTLHKCGISLSRVSVFYCNAPHPLVSRVFVSELQAFNSRLVSLCGLPGITSRACQAGLLAAFGGVVDLIRDLHYHYYTRSSFRGTLMELFGSAESFNPSQPISAQCLFIASAVQKMTTCWRNLLDFYRRQKQAEDVNLIRTRLMDPKLKLSFIFLSEILRPLQHLKELQQVYRLGVAVELQQAAAVIQSYATSVLRPAAAASFLRHRDLQLLHNESELLPLTQVKVGACAREFLWATAVVDLTEQDRRDFHMDAAAFYKAALKSLAESLPEHLGNVSLLNIIRVLKHSDSVNGNMLCGAMLSDLGVQLGLFSSGSAPEPQLACDYRDFIRTVKTQQIHGWAQMLPAIRPHSALRRLLLTILALPHSLHRTQVFDKVSKTPPASMETPDVSPQPQLKTGRPRIRKRRPAPTGYGDKKQEESSSEEDVKPPLQLPPKHHKTQDSDYTDNSSDVVDVTEEFKMSGTRRQVKTESESTPPSQALRTGCDDEDEEDCVIVTTPTNSSEWLGVTGELVWCHEDGSSVWPAIIVPSQGRPPPETRMVDWYGQNMSSYVSLQDLKPFAAFAQHFSANLFSVLVTYRVAVFLSLQEAAQRCKKHFSSNCEYRDEVLKHMLDWALGGFQPSGPDGLKPTADMNGVAKIIRPKVKQQLFPSASNMGIQMKEVSVTLNRLPCTFTDKFPPHGGGRKLEKGSRGGWQTEREDSASPGWEKGKGRGRGGKVQKKRFSRLDTCDGDMSPDFVPQKKRAYSKTYNKVVHETSSSYKQPDQKLRDETIRRIVDTKLDIEGFCLCCGTEDIEILHPLFKGGLCPECKDNLTETLYRYDEDGYQSYCTICCYGMEVILCGHDSCCRSYCTDCLNILVGPGSAEALKQLDPWICYLCQPPQTHGALTPREDWSIRVQELFANNSAMAFEPHRVYPSIPANLRRPVRVLSLFDGIATGYVVLKDLGFKVEKYVASEICEDSLAVATINHDGKIVHVGDVRFITQEHLQQWGPFDMLIGGSPCNDLSIVNPLRKGLYEGTGRLFFEFYRILQLLKPKEEDPRPFFWLFENVTFMNTHDKVNICRFLECNPVLVNAVKVSPAHRARYFWGNIPGMSRPIIASQSDKLNLQDCLEIGREARLTKVRTITTNPNSLKQGKGLSSLLPVLQGGKEDNLWITELERIFGFPKHYTDVRNMNRQQRQKVLGKAWSVPVVRHLFAPLKEYFACEELPPLTTSSSSSTSPCSPDSPDMQQLR